MPDHDDDRQRHVVTVRELCGHRRLPMLLLGLGVLRAILLLLAYPPAHTADSALFYLYAERLSGYYLPLLDRITYALYPFLILVTYKWLGSAFILIGLQVVMGILIAPIYYFALKPYSTALAALAAGLLLLDFQTGIVFNFTGTEPLYIFLLALALNVVLRMLAPNARPQAWWLAPVAGALLALLWLTRTVGRVLIGVYALLTAIFTREWRKSLTLLAGSAGILVLHALLSSAATGHVVGLTATDYTFDRMLRRHPEWVRSDNGPNTALWMSAHSACNLTATHPAYCLYKLTGDWRHTEAIIEGAVLETIVANLSAFVPTTWQNWVDFLSSSGATPDASQDLPSTMQCDSVEVRTEMLDEAFIRTGISPLTVSLLDLVDREGRSLEGLLPRFRAVLHAYMLSLCPPTPSVPALRGLVDGVMSLDASLAPPYPPLWYGLLLLIVASVPSARRYLSLVVVVGAALLALSLPFAVLSIAPYPRYVVPINSLRIILLSMMVLPVPGLVRALSSRLIRRYWPPKGSPPAMPC